MGCKCDQTIQGYPVAGMMRTNVQDFKALDRAVEEVKVSLAAVGWEQGLTPAALEAAVSQAKSALVKAIWAAFLECLDVREPRVLLDGVEHFKTHRCTTTYMTPDGPVELTRNLFRPVEGSRSSSVAEPVNKNETLAGWIY